MSAPQDRPLVFGRRHVLIGGAMLAASALAAARMPHPSARAIPSERFTSWVPDQVGSRHFSTESGVVLPPPDALSDRLYDNLVTRVYEGEGQAPITLLIAYNPIQNGVLQVHRPETCYSVGGFALTKPVDGELTLARRSVSTVSFAAVGVDRSEQVLYWTRVGETFPRAWSEQRLAVIRANLAGVIPDGMLMRLSILSNDGKDAQFALSQFAKAFVSTSPAPLRRILLGVHS